MRIISGRLKGILIQPPKGLPVRPTTDRAKESLFNILEHNFTIEQLEVLDLFSGTGNVSYEFLSRGAQKVVAVDMHFKCIEFIKLMKNTHAFSQLEVIKKDAFSFISSCQQQFDLVFADAPYALPKLYTLPDMVFKHQLLKNNGWLVVEHENTLDFNTHPQFVQKRVYGQSCFSFFK